MPPMAYCLDAPGGSMVAKGARGLHGESSASHLSATSGTGPRHAITAHRAAQRLCRALPFSPWRNPLPARQILLRQPHRGYGLGLVALATNPLAEGSTPPCSSTLWNSGIIPMREPARRDMVCPQARQEICVPESGGTGSTSSATSQCRHALAVSVLIGFDYSVRCRTRARLP
jgi:hypothetical protein